MDFISNSEEQVKEMLSVIGIKEVIDLFEDIPSSLLLEKPKKDDGLSEWDGFQYTSKLLEKNSTLSKEQYLGAGAYEHHVPAIVSAICAKSEFLTAYTPYQPEVSQGLLQAIFEFQSAICAITGMDVSNASVYDAASACAEAMLLTLRHHKKRNKILLSDAVHPYYQSVVRLYLEGTGCEIISIPFDQKTGQTELEAVHSHLDNNVAGLLIQSPNFFGHIEQTSEIASTLEKTDGLLVQCGNPLSYGLYESPGALGASIAVGDAQPFGLPLQFGGPYVGYVACRKELVRQMPGRIVGETVDTKGQRGFVLTLQAREQHIRRDKATSNICTNQSLAALAALVGLLWQGKKGVHELALSNFRRASYLREGLQKLGFPSFGSSPIFNEFVIDFQKPVDEVLHHFHSFGIEPGVPLQQFYPELKQSLLVAVTEIKSVEMLDRYLEVAQGALA